MPILKKILFPLISVFLAYHSIELIKLFNKSSPTDFSLSLILILSFLLNLFITGIFAFIGFAYASSSFLPNSYYKIKNPKTLNNLYSFLGVKYFKTFLLITFWGKEKNRKKYFNGTKSGLINFDFQTKQSEFGHLAAFVTIILASVILLLNEHVIAFLLTTTINILSNLYPIVLQRKHRTQIENLTKRVKNKRISV